MSRLLWILILLCFAPSLALGDDTGFGWPSSNDEASEVAVADAPVVESQRVDTAWRPTVPIEITALRLEATGPAPLLGVGDLMLDSDAAVLAAQDLVKIDGDLRIEGLGHSVTLPNLQSVSGSIRIDAVNGEWVSFPALERVGGDVVLSRASVDVWDLPVLEHVGGSLTLSIVSTLRAVEFPALLTAARVIVYQGADLARLSAPRLVTAGVDISQSPLLSALELPVLKYAENLLLSETALNQLSMDALTRVGRLKVSGDHSITNIVLPALGEAGELFVEDVPQVSRVELPQVRVLAYLVLQSNIGLSSVSLPQLALNGGVYVIYNDQLSSFSMPMLQRSDSVGLYNNVALPVRPVVRALQRPGITISHECNADDDCYEGGC